MVIIYNFCPSPSDGWTIRVSLSQGNNSCQSLARWASWTFIGIKPNREECAVFRTCPAVTQVEVEIETCNTRVMDSSGERTHWALMFNAYTWAWPVEVGSCWNREGCRRKMIVCSEHDSSIYRSFDDENMRSVQLQQFVGEKKSAHRGKSAENCPEELPSFDIGRSCIVCGAGE